MTILFHPSFDRGYYMNWGKGADILGKKVVGMAGLLDHLSLHNGLSGRFASDGERAASYLAEVGKCAKGSWIEEPFKNDSLGVAKCLLGWRDLLIMAGWTPDRRGTELTPKLQLLSRIEDLWKARIKGSADRWLELAKLAERQSLLNEGDVVKCTCAKEQLPLLVQKVLEASHADFAKYPDKVQIPDDLIVKVLHYNDMLDVYRQVAAGKLEGDVFINRDNVSLNHILLSWGKPLLDATIQNSNPLSLQLFKLALSVFSRPLNIQNLLSYFLLPVGPIPGKLRTALANVLVTNGGFGEIDWDVLEEEKAQALKAADISSKWEQAIWEYVENEDESSELTRVKRQEKMALLSPITDKAIVPEGTIPVNKLKEYIGVIDQWAASFAYGKEIEDEVLKAQLCSVISYFKQLLETLEGREDISYKELEKSINTIYQPMSIVQARAQVGSIKVIGSYQQMVDAPDSLVWLDCCGADVLADPYDFLNAQERSWLNGQKTICIPRLQDLLELDRREMIVSLARIKGEIVLITSDYHHNQKMTEHPFLAELKMQRGNRLEILEGSTELPHSESKTVLKIEPKADYVLGTVEYAGRSESNTSIDTLISYPFDYTVHYVAKLGEPSKKELGTIGKVMGLVAHLFIQNLVNDVRNLPDANPLTSISRLVDTEYDIRLENAIQLTGLALLLKENEVEYNNLRFLLKRSVKTLVKIMEHERLTPVGCELKYDLPVFSDGSDFNARIDMELMDSGGNAVIFDFKWTYSSYYGEKIKDGTAIQLELYRKELEKQGKTVRGVGYYLLPKCILETSNFDTFKDDVTNQIIIRHIDPPAENDLFYQIENSVCQRKEEIHMGDIEEGEEMDIKDLPYSKALLEGKNLLLVGEIKRARATKKNPDPPVMAIKKESQKVFVNKPESRFRRLLPEFQEKDPPCEKPTTYPLLKGRLK